jgi:hypothetical protein
MAKTTKTQRVAMFQALSEALKADYPPNAPFVLASQSYTRAEVTSSLDACVAASSATSMAKAKWMAASFKERALHQKGMGLRRMLGKFLAASLGERSPNLRKYGLAPLKIGKKTLAVKRAAAQKAKETRKSRFTMGRRQKAKIKGTSARAR